MRYAPELDGLRAVAILAVVAYHVSPARLRGGFTGVDVFFVLSGFLIASVILRDLQDRSFSLAGFYGRRVLRLMPNGLLMILVVTGLWTTLLPPSLSKPLGEHALWALANLSNVYIRAHVGGYWTDTARVSPLLHTWSLAIEEQFYLLFPTGLIVVARYRRTRLAHWLGLGCAASFAYCLYAGSRFPDDVFYLLPGRAWELLAGATLASLGTAAGPFQRAAWLELAGWAGFGSITIGFFLVPEGPGFPGISALIPTAGTVMVLAAATRACGIARFLASRPLVIVGKMSYSLYLWHWPLLLLGRFEAGIHGIPERLGRVAGLGAGIAAAAATYRWIEVPMRERGPAQLLRLKYLAAGFVVAVGASVFVEWRPPLGDSNRYFDTPEYYGLAYGFYPPNKDDIRRKTAFAGVHLGGIDKDDNGVWRNGGVRRYGSTLPEIAVLGSSHALMYSHLIDTIAQKNGVSIGFLGLDAAPLFFYPVSNRSAAPGSFDDTRRSLLREWKPKAVFAIDRWDYRFADGADFKTDLRSFLREVAPFTGSVYFVSQVPVLRTPLPLMSLRDYAVWRAGTAVAEPQLFPDEGELERKTALHAASELAPEFPNLKVLRPDLVFYRADGSVRWHSGRTLFYIDTNHLSDAGAEAVRDVFEDAIANVLHRK